MAQSCHNQNDLQLIMIIIQDVSCETIKDLLLLDININNKIDALMWFLLLGIVFNK